MHYTACLHPKLIVNPYTKEQVYVPCRKCSACRNNVSRSWVTRLEQERRCWKYTFFVTLKYDNDHIPTLEKLDWSYKDKILNATLIERSTGQLFNLTCEDTQEWSEKDINYFLETDKFWFPDTLLIQKFIKLLRYYAKEQDKEASIRYYINSEFGPTTFRLHHHGLLFTNSEKFAKAFKEILSKTWKNGNCSYELVESSASSYVAAYCNATTHLPAIYRVSKLCPKSWMSRKPPIGTLVVKSEEIQRLFNSASAVFTLYDGKRKEFFTTALWRCLKDRLYPRLPGYDTVPCSLRVQLYGLVDKESFTDLSDFFTFCQREVEKGTDIGRYLALIKRPCDADDVPTLHSWKSVYYISKRVYYQRRSFGVSLKYYVEQIQKFYENENYLKLQNQLSFEEKNSTLEELPFLLNVDAVFLDNCLHTEYDDLSSSSKAILESYGVDKYNFYFLDYYHFSNTKDYIQHERLQNKIFKENGKSKLKNAYLEANKEKFKNVIHFYGTT